MSFKNISSDQHAAFVSALRSGQYNLLLGAGASMDSHNKVGPLPSGNAFKETLCKLKNIGNGYSLQRVFSLLKPPEVAEHVTKRFVGSVPGETSMLIGGFVWKRIYSWNIDDVLENLYRAGQGRQDMASIHFNDPFADSSTLAELQHIHLHGFAGEPDKGYVFSRNEYISNIKNLSHWMVVLTQQLQTEPFIVSGTSLDEMDLDFYLAHRTAANSRSDRGPSILVEKTDDPISAELCAQHNLIQFVGYSRDFFEYCAKVLPNRPTPYELIPSETRSFLPPGVSKAAALAFHADLEIVPSSANASEANPRFHYGHSPTWSDLEATMDVPRARTINIVTDIERRLADLALPRMVLVTEDPGTGKTTVLRRVAFELAKRTIRVLNCSALGRLDRSITSTLDLIDEPVVLVIDNLADQAPAVMDFLTNLEKKDFVIVGAERAYRKRYLRQVFAGEDFRLFDDLALQRPEAETLLERYIALGVVSGEKGKKPNLPGFVTNIAQDPIAVACCRILNDFRPLERIISDLVSSSSSTELDRYAIASIARHCFVGGVRHEVLVSACRAPGIHSQLTRDHVLPLIHSDLTKAFITPLNATVSERVLAHLGEHDPKRVLAAFISLANAIGPWVNREAIIRRAPEARLSGRLFDYDDVVCKFLGASSAEFYEKVQPVWQWNSRYWEQVALLNFAKFTTSSDPVVRAEAIEKAVQHARHAVFIEHHPFPLSTLGKVLMAYMLVPGVNMASTYSDAFDRLKQALEREALWKRHAVHPYVFLFSGTLSYLDHGGVLSASQIDGLESLTSVVGRRFPRDGEVQELNGTLVNRIRAIR